MRAGCEEAEEEVPASGTQGRLKDPGCAQCFVWRSRIFRHSLTLAPRKARASQFSSIARARCRNAFLFRSFTPGSRKKKKAKKVKKKKK